MYVYNLYSLFWDGDEQDIDFGHHATFATAEAAMAAVPAELDENAGARWRKIVCDGRSRWITLQPRGRRYHHGGTSGFVVDEDVLRTK